MIQLTSGKARMAEVRIACWLAAGLLALIAGDAVCAPEFGPWWQAVPVETLLVQEFEGADPPGWTVEGGGRVVDDELVGKAFLAEDRTVRVSLGTPHWRGYAAEFMVRLAVSPAPFEVRAYPSTQEDLRHPCECMLSLMRRDKAGDAITVYAWAYDRKYDLFRYRDHYEYVFRPKVKKLIENLEQAGLRPEGWGGRWLHVKVEAGERALRVWFEGRLGVYIADPVRKAGGVALTLAKGDMIARVKAFRSLSPDSRFLPIDLSGVCNNEATRDLGDGWRLDPEARPAAGTYVEVDGVPFYTGAGAGGADNLCLRSAEWPEWRTDPGSYYENYDCAPFFQGDPRTPILRVPNACYSAAYVVGMADTMPETSTVVSIRTGIFDRLGIYHDVAGEAPRWTETGGKWVVKPLPALLLEVGQPGEKRGGNLFMIRIPLGGTFPQDFEVYGDSLALELTKELRLAVRQPDPCRFRIRPLGLPSSVHIFGFTLEESPVRMRVTSPEIGHVFVEPQTPTFTVRLTSVVAEPRTFGLAIETQDFGGAEESRERTVELAPGETREETIRFEGRTRGWRRLSVAVVDEEGRRLLQRETSFALLPPDTRNRAVYGPWSTWTWAGAHNTPDFERIGPLLRKCGVRYALRSASDSELARYGLRANQLGNIQRKKTPGEAVAMVSNDMELYPNGVREALVFHETAISGKHVMRPLDCLVGRDSYEFDEAEQARFDELWQQAVSCAKAVKEAFPGYKLAFGNNAAMITEEFLRRGFPKDLIDSISNESAGFMRPTECQPDPVSFNGLWMFDRIRKHYGYGDKQLAICYEWLTRATNPGNLSLRDQAAYYVRDCLLALAFGVPRVSPAGIVDVGNSYYYSNWGAGGLCRQRPELNPKPAYAAYATLTLMLDEASCERRLDTGSTSLFGLVFRKPDKSAVCAFWTLRGTRQASVRVDQKQPATLTDGMGNAMELPPRNGVVTFAVGALPVFLSGVSDVREVSPGECAYPERPGPDPLLIDDFDRPGRWTKKAERDPELEFYNFLTPRRLGKYRWKTVREFEGRRGCLRVSPQTPVPGAVHLPMYGVLELDESVPIPGEPRHVGLWVNGNSGWGRVIFEFVDASGQRWISIGCAMSGQVNRWMEDWMPKEVLAGLEYERSINDWNTNDSERRSSINFDGWRYVDFPLPGQYPGEGYHWPRNCYWKYDKDGKVHYPLTFTKLVVELREKIVYVTELVEPLRKEILLDDLMVTY